MIEDMPGNLLPEIPDRDRYRELFSKDEIWEPAVLRLAARYGLEGRPVRGNRGSHIVYRAGVAWIKLMAPIFAKDMAFEVAGLECARGRLKVATPEILGRGELEGWRYIVVSHVEGRRIGDVWGELGAAEKSALARQAGAVTRELQACAPSEQVHARGDWNAFIRERFARMVDHHRLKSMDERWLSRLSGFLGTFDVADFSTDRPVFLHADLTFDHFLVATDSSGAPRISGVIDFADCRVGHPEYDVPATAAFIFKGEALPLAEYLRAAGFAMGPRAAEKMLAWTCLHFYSDLRNYFEKEMIALPAGDFVALARAVYPFETG